jgi:hypothetical protein
MADFRSRTALLASLLLAGCTHLVRAPGPIAVDPDATFAAHQVHEGFIVDRLSDGRTAEVVSPSWFRMPGSPTFVLERENERLASLFLGGPAKVESRVAAGPAGRVEPSWEEGAVRLTLRPPDGPAFMTDVFKQTGTAAGWSVLTRGAQNQLDLRGGYRAELRDAAGKTVGWLRVRIGPYQQAPRIFDARLPSAIGDPLAAGAVVALSSEIDWIESHTLDVYRGDRSGPLEQSVPIGR